MLTAIGEGKWQGEIAIKLLYFMIFYLIKCLFLTYRFNEKIKFLDF
nr:MAG TPA: hypothetical protein [Caudoviricetes sp.]